MKTIGRLVERLLILPLSLIFGCTSFAPPPPHAPSAQVESAPAFIPLPAQVNVTPGPGFAFGETLPVFITGNDRKAAKQAVLTSLGLAGVKTTTSSWAVNSLCVTVDASKKEAMGAEGYTLTVTPAGITLTAAAPAGLFYGAQTLAQAVVKDAAGKPAIPSMVVTDSPRFGWRGLLLDSSRHFIKKDDVKRMIDLMAMHKFNIFHWHLTDDQGWRIEIKKYPKLTEIGSHRVSSPIPGRLRPFTSSDSTPYGGFYTQEEIKDVVAYAKARFITIIPEIDMPGHSTAAIASYPWLGNQDSPGYNPRVVPIFGITKEYNNYTLRPSEETFTFVDGVMTEVAALFPDAPYIHVGGDECDKTQWRQSAFAQKVMADNKLKTPEELQSYFIKRVEKIVNAKGKRLIGWDEIQEGGLSKTATMMVWREWHWAVEAVNHGNDIVMSPTSHAYLDVGPGANPGDVGFQTIGWHIPLEKVYDFEPVPGELRTPEQIKHVLGCQGNLWGEMMFNQPKLEYMAFPRALAMAEVAWTPRELKNRAGFMKRLEGHLPMLDAKKVNYRKQDGSEAQPWAVEKATHGISEVIGQWSPKDITTEWKTVEWALPAASLAQMKGILFAYSGGEHRLEMQSAALVVDGKVVAEDKHFGFASAPGSENTYTLAVPTGTSCANGGVLRAVVRGGGGNDSRGLVGLLPISLAVGCALVAPPPQAPPVETPASAKLAKPTPGLVEFQKLGFGLFVHWSPSVYQGTECDNLSTPKDKINPDRFDADQIVRAAQSCGAGYIVFVAKHVGGYCAWQTDTTDYSIKTSPWKNGKGDMVGELAAACRKSGLKFGVYLCPRDDSRKIRNAGIAPTPDKQPEVDAFYRRQITELLTKYGTLFEIWFDGSCQIPVNDLIAQYAPDLVTFGGRRLGSSRWIGNESGFAPYPCWSTVNGKVGEVPPWQAPAMDGNLWAPAECDVSILRPDWFWRPGADAHVLSLAALDEIYYLSVGRNCNLLLNIAPDDHGAVSETQMRRLAEFGSDLRARFGTPLASTARTFTDEKAELILPLDGEKTVDHIRLCEDVRGGERIRRFKVWGKKPAGGWTCLVSGTQVGARQIIPFAPVSATELKLDIIEAAAPPAVKEFAAFHVTLPVPATAYRAGNRTAMRAPKMNRSRDGHFSIDCPTPEWEARFTLDGSEPTRESSLYREPHAFPDGGILKARYFDREDRQAVPGPVLTRHLGLPAETVTVLGTSSQDAQCPGPAAFDGDPKTAWHTAWRPAKAALPHSIVLDLGKSRQVSGLAFLPRQDAPGNQADGVRIFVADRIDGFPKEASFEGSFGDYKANPMDWHEVVLPTPVAGRYVKLVFPSVASNGPCLTAAEMEILVKASP